MYINDPELWAILNTTVTEQPGFTAGATSVLPRRTPCQFLKYVRGEDSRAIGTLASGLPSVKFSAEREAVASVDCGPGLDVITGESGRRPPSAPRDRRHTVGGLRLRDLFACGPRERSHLRRVRPQARRQRIRGMSLLHGGPVATTVIGGPWADARALRAPSGPLPRRISRCGAVTAPCGAPRPPSSHLRGPRAAEGLGVVRTLPAARCMHPCATCCVG